MPFNLSLYFNCFYLVLFFKFVAFGYKTALKMYCLHYWNVQMHYSSSSVFLWHVHFLNHPQIHRRGQQGGTGGDSSEHPVCHTWLFVTQVLLGTALQWVANQVYSAAQALGQHSPERISCLASRKFKKVRSQLKGCHFWGAFYVSLL